MVDPIRMTFAQPMLNQFEFLPTTAYDFKPVEWARVARLCWWVLKKIKAVTPHFDKQMMVTSIVIDPREAADKIIKMAMPQLELMSGQLPERILLGQKQFAELHQCTDIMYRPFCFTIEARHTKTPAAHWHEKYRQPKIEVFGLVVEVIPWMDGVLVL